MMASCQNVGRKLNKKKIPVVATLSTAILTGTLTLFLDLEVLSSMISAGTLLSYSIVCACVLIIRYKSRSTFDLNPRFSRVNNAIFNRVAKFINDHVYYFLMYYFIFCTAFALSIKMDFSWLSKTIYISVCIILVLLFSIIKPQEIDTFSVPLIPLTPLLGIFINTLLILQLPFESLLRLLEWTLVGIFIYFVYGIHNSNLVEKKVKTTEDESIIKEDSGI